MADSNDTQDRPCTRTSHYPPPSDPFTRYQSPWSRNEKEEEQNPFVQFRRFADEQFQSLFSGIPKLIGTFSSDTDAVKQEFRQMMQKRHEFEEGFRKQLEQDLEEARQGYNKPEQSQQEEQHGLRPVQRDAGPDTSRPPWWQQGRAARCPGLKDMPSENARKCPAMFDKDGKPLTTELDLYNAITRDIWEKAESPRLIPDHDFTSRKIEEHKQRLEQEWLALETGLGRKETTANC